MFSEKVFWFSSMCSYWNASIPGPAGESVPVYCQTSEIYLKNIHIRYLCYLLLFMSCKKMCTTQKHYTMLWVIQNETSVKNQYGKFLHINTAHWAVFYRLFFSVCKDNNLAIL